MTITRFQLKIFAVIWLPLLISACTPVKQLEPSPYTLVGQSSLHLNLIASGKMANNPDVMETQCKLHLFINPNGQEVAVSARMRKSKNYNDEKDLRYLGYSYKVKFTKNDDGIIKISKPLFCNKKTQWRVENMQPDYGLKLFITWEGYWNGVEELANVVVAKSMAEILQIGDTDSHIIIGLAVDPQAK